MLFRSCCLFFLSTHMLQAKMIYEQLPERQIQKCQYATFNSVSFSYTSPKQWNIDLPALLGVLSKNRVKTVATGRTEFDVNAVLAPVSVYLTVCQLEDRRLGLSMSVRVEGAASNGCKGDIHLLDRSYLLEIDNQTKTELEELIRNSLYSFVEEYVASHEANLKDVTFYVLS